MRKLSAIFLALVFAASLFTYGCSASGKISVDKQQGQKIIRLAK